MALISQSIPNLVNGVSQQPFTLRLSSQCELQENGLSTTAQGLRKRPPTKHVKKILSTQIANAYLHTINRDENERYVVVITNGDLKVFDLAGVEKTVSFPSGKTYLNSASPSTSFRAVTVADYTFILNKNTTITQRADKSPARKFEALVNVKQGNFFKEYIVRLNGVDKALYKTPDGSAASHNDDIATDYIAKVLFWRLIGSVGNIGATNGPITYGGFTFTRYGSVIHIEHPTTDFTCDVYDGFNNSAMKVLKNQVQSFSDLPFNAGVNNFAIEIAGDESNGFDNYWVKFDSSGSGAWKETLKPNEFLGYTASTMPHTLVRNADGTFTFGPATWEDRSCGTLKVNPDPSFVGKKISDIFFYRNRLGFLSDEAIVMSEASEFFNFYRTTVTELLDSDPIDASVSHTKVSSLLYAVPYNRKLLAFSAQTQFAVTSGDLLTPKTISILQSTEFESNPSCPPVGFGNNIYFAVNRGDYTGIREYYTVDEASGTNDATDITAHVPSYIPKNTFKIAAGLNENILVALSSTERNACWVYKFFFNNNEKLQSSWSKWTFHPNDQILNVDFILSDLFFVIQRTDGVYIEKMSLSTGDVGANELFNVHLDRKLTVLKANMTFDGTYTNIPTAYLPSGITEGDWEAVVATGQGKKAGLRIPLTSTANGARMLGNFTDSDLVVGRKYSLRYKFSPITIKVQAGQGQKADTVGRLQIRNLQINYADTGYFKVKVTPRGRTTYEYVFSGKTLGLSTSTIGSISVETGLFKFPILAQNTEVDIEITSDAPLPVSFLSADWEGMYVKRSRGV